MWLGAIGVAMAGGLLVDGPQAAALVAGGATVLDTRSWLAYRTGHIPGAQRVDWRIGVTGGAKSGTLGDPTALAAALALLGVDDGRPVLVVGAWTSGWGEEGRLLWDLAYLGHGDAHLLRGGMAAWAGATQILADMPQPGVFTARVQPALRVDRAAVSSGGWRLLDVREPEEFAGAILYGEARGGHIAGASSLPWRDLLASPPPPPDDDPVAVYCTGGVRSGLAYAVLRDAGWNVANYDGGWWEWARTAP
jgi:thiosulfate/3-mercaptopyruvate sulfurtransferase